MQKMKNDRLQQVIDQLHYIGMLMEMVASSLKQIGQPIGGTNYNYQQLPLFKEEFVLPADTEVRIIKSDKEEKGGGE